MYLLHLYILQVTKSDFRFTVIWLLEVSEHSLLEKSAF